MLHTFKVLRSLYNSKYRTVLSCIPVFWSREVFTLHDWWTTRGHPLHDPSPGETPDESVLSQSYVLSCQNWPGKWSGAGSIPAIAPFVSLNVIHSTFRSSRQVQILNTPDISRSSAMPQRVHGLRGSVNFVDNHSDLSAFLMQSITNDKQWNPVYVSKPPLSLFLCVTEWYRPS